MKTIEDYRTHADECRLLARRARTPEERELILTMAAAWENLAETRLKMLAGQLRMRADEDVRLRLATAV